MIERLLARSAAARLTRRARRRGQRLAVFRVEGDVTTWPVMVDTDVDEVCEIGSITKVLTGLLLASLDVRGHTPIGTEVAACFDLVDSACVDGGELTLSDLAVHHGGVPRLSDAVRAADVEDPYRDTTAASVIDEFGHWASTDASSATRRFEYSNLGYAVLGHALAARLAQTWDAAVKELLASFEVDDVWPVGPVPGRSIGTPRDRSGNEVSRWDMGGYAPAGGASASARGLAGLAQALLRAHADPDHTMHEAVQRSVSASIELKGRRSVGLGWHIVDDAKRGMRIWHNGATAGSVAFLALQPSSNSAVGLVGSGPPDNRTDRDVFALR